MKKLLLCLLAITAAISTAWAQTPKKNIFGLRVGMDMSKISILGLEKTLTSLAGKLVQAEVEKRTSPLLSMTITDLLKR